MNEQYLQIYPYFSGSFFGQVNSTNCCTESVAQSSVPAWYFADRTGSTASYIQKNSTQNTGFTQTTGVVNNNIYVLAQNVAGTAGNFDPNQIAFIWLGSSLSTTQATTLYSIIQAFQTRLSRQI